MSVRRRTLSRLLVKLGPPVLAALFAGCSEGEHPQSVFRPVSQFAETLDHLFDYTMWITMPLMALVLILLVYIVFRFRERPDAEPPRHIHGNVKLEVAWTIVPALIIVALAVPSVRTIWETQAKPAPNSLVVQVIGHQWWWEFRYPEYGVVTANEMRLPVGRPVDLQMRSADVIHDFWIPRLGGKRDVNPAPAVKNGQPLRVNHITFTPDSLGMFYGQCAEYCGDSHALMRMRALVQPPDSFLAWVQRMKTPVEPATGTLAAQGKQIFQSHACLVCHTVEGTNARGIIGPNLTRLGERERMGAQELPTTVANVAAWIKRPQDFKPGARMPGTREGAAGMPPTGLTDDQVHAVAVYLTSLKGGAPAPSAAPGAPAATGTPGAPAPAPTTTAMAAAPASKR